MKIYLSFEEVTLDGDYGPVDGLIATCTNCGHEVEVFGTEESSVERAAALMREECPKNEKNFYDISRL